MATNPAGTRDEAEDELSAELERTRAEFIRNPTAETRRGFPEALKSFSTFVSDGIMRSGVYQ